MLQPVNMQPFNGADEDYIKNSKAFAACMVALQLQ